MRAPIIKKTNITAWRYAVLFSTLLLATIFISCSSAYFKPQAPLSPVVRVGIVLDAEEIKFEPGSSMTITPRDGEQQYRSEQNDVWTVRINKNSITPAPYRLLLGESAKKSEAKKIAKEYEDKSIKTDLVQEGDELWYAGKLVAGSSTFRVYATEKFDTQANAQSAKDSNSNLSTAKVVPSEETKHGDIVLISPKGDPLTIKNALRLSGGEFTIHDVKVGEGYHWSRQEKRTYNGELEIRINNNGNLVAINVIPAEDYLHGVLPGEMSSTFPLEALKAQAIAARTFFLYNFTKVHRNDPFDVCADVHCQVYVGGNRSDEKIARAIKETRGLVLLHDDELCSTPFSAVCGGHTEHSNNVWSGDPLPYLQGVFDIENPQTIQAKFDLSQENNARTWIESLPDVFCNVEKNGSPSYANYAKKFFRWQVTLSRQELEQSIQNYTGQQIGSLVNLRAKSRGVSGRIIELEVQGTTNTITIGKELRIRKALSPTTLYSGCIVFDKIGAEDGLPDSFIIKGAGWGHGVGMCQIGAALMAEKGHNAGDILKHYYSNTRIRQLY